MENIMKHFKVFLQILVLLLFVIASISCTNFYNFQKELHRRNSTNNQKSISSKNIGRLQYVPPGRFQRNDKTENISIITKAYYMSQYQITRSQFKAIMGEDPSVPTYSTGENDPVQTVSWYHAIAFCNKLSINEARELVYSVEVLGVEVDWENLAFSDIPIATNTNWDAVTQDLTKNGYRLPTEMEWMWAAMGAPLDGRGDKPNTSGYLKAFAGDNGNNKIDDYAWYFENAESKTHPVGKKRPNELILYDMSGNVFEWCWDWGANYPLGTLEDYAGPSTGQHRMYRGGSWGRGNIWFYLSERVGIGPIFRGDYLGFRVVCSEE